MLNWFKNFNACPDNCILWVFRLRKRTSVYTEHTRRIPFFEEHRFHRARAFTRFPTRQNINNNKTEEPDNGYTSIQRCELHHTHVWRLPYQWMRMKPHHIIVLFRFYFSCQHTPNVFSLYHQFGFVLGFSYHNWTYIGLHTHTVVIRNEIKQKSYKTDVYNIKNGSNTQNFGIIKGLPQILPLFYFPFFSEFILLYDVFANDI